MQPGATCKWHGQGNEVRKWSQGWPSHHQGVWEKSCRRTSAFCHLSLGVILAERMAEWGRRASFSSLKFVLGRLGWCYSAVRLAKGWKSIPRILNNDRKMQHAVITFEACMFSCCMLLLVQLWLKELAWSISTSFSSVALFSGGFL